MKAVKEYGGGETSRNISDRVGSFGPIACLEPVGLLDLDMERSEA
jgi:hypothetical protein